ncbi:MAG: hypothetical protein JXB23_05340 [Candidatus Aminicenantes bacterium]|nr:hypothetical protein [Candidatus Aminicenantes bacterium]
MMILIKVKNDTVSVLRSAVYLGATLLAYLLLFFKGVKMGTGNFFQK